MQPPCIPTAAEWISLTLIPGLGVTTFWRLVDHFGSPGAVLTASPRQLQQVKSLTEKCIAGLANSAATRSKGESELARLHSSGGNAILYGDSLYPALLKQLNDPPPVLFVKGNTSLLQTEMVALVGSRAATTYGRRICARLARELSDNQVTVVSGLAAGIDAEAHAGALGGAGNTIAVLGCGLDVVYPKQNWKLYRQIGEDGLLLSEYPFGTKPDGFRFPARNRIIAGMCKGVVVVEAARNSGSLITAQIGLDYGRDIFAVPGQVDSVKSEGTHWLLRQGAKLVGSGLDILEEYQRVGPFSSAKLQHKQNSHLDLEPDAVALLSLLDVYPQPREIVLAKSGMSPARLSELTLLLELEGMLELLPGDMIRRIN